MAGHEPVIARTSTAGPSRALAGAAALLLMVAGLALSDQARSYEPETHREITYLAAKVLTRCLVDAPAQTGHAPTEPLFTPLEIRAVANASARHAGGGAWGRPFRWQYYDPLDRPGGMVDWVVSTRFNPEFADDMARLARQPARDRALNVLGRVVGHVQLVTAPARALPVFAPRFWRGSLGDRFDQYPLQVAALEARLDANCDALAQLPPDLPTLLAATADETRRAIDGAVGGFPTTWADFWTPPEAPGEFGSYGPAGNNFGRYVEFPCGPNTINRCVLITDDPAYTAFAEVRHMAAVRATAQALLLFQRQQSGARAALLQQGEEQGLDDQGLEDQGSEDAAP